MSLFKRWRIVSICYMNDLKLLEVGRTVGRVEYWTRAGARREIAWRKRQDALRNDDGWVYKIVSAA